MFQLLGVVAGLFIFLLCVHLSGKSSASPDASSNSRLNPDHAYKQKRLLVNSDEGGYDDNDVFDAGARGVAFIPGVPGHGGNEGYMKVPKQMPQVID